MLFDGARVPAADMVGEPGEGWRLAMTVVSHEREPGELGFVARYRKAVEQLARRCASDPERFGAEQVRDLGWAIVEAEMLRLHVCRRLSDRLGRHHPRARGLGRQAADDPGGAGRRPRRRSRSGAPATTAADDTWLKVYLYSRAQSVMGGTSQIQRNLVATRILGLPTT